MIEIKIIEIYCKVGKFNFVIYYREMRKESDMKINNDNFIAELRKKNEKSLEYIIDEYGALVNGIVRNTLINLNNYGLIEECVSDVFLGVWNNIDKFTGDAGKFKSWICCIAKYKAIDYYRSYKSDKQSSFELDENLCSDENIEEKVLQRMHKRDVIKAINDMDEPDKSIFLMKFFLGMSSSDISEKLNLTCSNVDVKVSRGRKKLRELFSAI